MYRRCAWDDWLERAKLAEASKPRPPQPPKRVMHQGREMRTGGCRNRSGTCSGSGMNELVERQENERTHISDQEC
jgi:hypothetical protein